MADNTASRAHNLIHSVQYRLISATGKNVNVNPGIGRVAIYKEPGLQCNTWYTELSFCSSQDHNGTQTYFWNSCDRLYVFTININRWVSIEAFSLLQDRIRSSYMGDNNKPVARFVDAQYCLIHIIGIFLVGRLIMSRSESKEGDEDQMIHITWNCTNRFY